MQLAYINKSTKTFYGSYVTGAVLVGHITHLSIFTNRPSESYDSAICSDPPINQGNTPTPLPQYLLRGRRRETRNSKAYHSLFPIIKNPSVREDNLKLVIE